MIYWKFFVLVWIMIGLNEYKRHYFKTIIYLTGYLSLQAVINVPLCFFFLIPNFNNLNSEWEIYHTIILKNPNILLNLILFSFITLVAQILLSNMLTRKFKTLETMKPHNLHWIWSYLIFFGIVSLVIIFLDFFYWNFFCAKWKY